MKVGLAIGTKSKQGSRTGRCGWITSFLRSLGSRPVFPIWAGGLESGPAFLPSCVVGGGVVHRLNEIPLGLWKRARGRAVGCLRGQPVGCFRFLATPFRRPVEVLVCQVPRCPCFRWVCGWLFDSWIVCASILYLWWPSISGIRWMPWHQAPMKDAGGRDRPRGAVNRALIRGCPNGGTQPESCRVAAV